MTARLGRALAGLRGRIALLLIGGLLVGALGFYGLLDFLSRNWSRTQLIEAGREEVERLARDVSMPVLLGDRMELRRIVARVARGQDAVGAAILDPDGAILAHRVIHPDLWARQPITVPGEESPGVSVTRDRAAGVDVHTLLAPVLRHRRVASLPSGAFDLPNALRRPAPSAEPELIGWVRFANSSARFESDLATARQLGLLMLCLVLGMGLVGSLALLRVVVRPLREASGLAREIAEGNLHRRLPVRARDELGALAESMNTMAEALAGSRERERVEAAALRETAEAVIAVAQGARTARDPAAVFRVVAAELRRVTQCHGVALAVPDPELQRPRFAHFDPAPPWGGLYRGAELDPPLAAAFAGLDPPPLRLRTVAHDLPLAGILAARGFAAALLVPLAHESGPPAILLLVSRDDSAFRPAELRVVAGLAEHLAASLHAAQLSDRLQSAFAELHRTQEQLVRAERLRMAGELASGIAHEFNNVLAAILGRVQLLRLRAREGTLPPHDLEDAFGVMELAARDGADTVRRLRRFSIGESGDRTETVDLDAVVREAVEFTRPRWKSEGQAGGARVELEIGSAPGAWVHGSPGQLREVFTNLILNAVDALPQGGTIRAGTALRHDMVTAYVEDDGEGMDAETLKRAFEPFFTTKGVSGTGLGLSMVYGIVQQHGGRLSARSEPARGSRMDLAFPRAEAPAPVTPPILTAPPAAACLSVMVVDDEPAVRELLVDILRALGHSAEGKAGGEEALDAYQPGRFDLVLTDLGMPGLDGWQLCEALRAVDDGLTIAFVTGWGEAVEPERMRAAGAQAVVAKPFAIEDVERVVELAAGRAQRRAA